MITQELLTLSPELIASLWFAAAVVLIDLFDIALPRGDSVGVSGALIVAGLVIAGPEYMAPLALLALVLAHIGQNANIFSRVVGGLASRLAAITAASLLIALLDVSAEYNTIAVLKLGLVSATYLIIEVVAAQLFLALFTKRPLYRLLAGNLRRHALLIGAQTSTAVLAAITYPQMGAWSLVLVVALLLLIRQSYASLLEIRETYRSTVEVLVEVAEGQDERLSGHAERSAQIARNIGERLGMNSIDLERISYTTLLHDIDALAGRESMPEMGSSSQVFEGTTFFDDVLPALRLCDGCAAEIDITDQNLIIAMIAALSSDIDAARHPQVAEAQQRMAVSRVAAITPSTLKARVVAAAIELGYKIPAMD